ncbi:hypothetical protein HYX10_04085 [Candidatus Woesearchaeota archaeon]|nr:hypothetical protein [Candidatus Woesearchaeota archaeon]
MECAKCGKPAADEQCGSCLVKSVEKKARKALPKITGNSRILVINDGSCEGKVSEYLARKLITITEVSCSKLPKEGYDVVLHAHTADKKASDLLEFMLESRKTEPAQSLLGQLLRKEIAAYAKIKNIACDAEKSGQMVEKLEQRSKGSTHALARVSEEILGLGR